MNETQVKVTEILLELTALEEVSLSASLTTDLALDSLKMVMILIQIEDAFGIELQESDMNPFLLKTGEDIVTLVEKYKAVNSDE